MSIRFKFRSSVTFDTIEIDGGKPYISVGELRSKILCQKKLNDICHRDFDLVLSDEFTGQEYNDEKFKIPSGSSVIIKRVPVETVPSAMLRQHKLEASELSEDIPKDADMYHTKPDEIVPEKLSPEDSEHVKLKRMANTAGIDLQNVDLPSELRCPICNTYFKEAVMIPCCQHSFCKKCICEVLPKTTRCPKCSSTKYRVENLLPNLSLRHAIEHFLESQILATAPENNLRKYVPDGESGIQGKEVSTVTKRKLDFLYSTSATDKGSNQNMAESVHDSQIRQNGFLEGTRYHTGKPGAVGLLNSPLLKVTSNNGGRHTHEDLAPHADSQGENQPVIPQVCIPDEADSTARKRGSWVNPGGGDRSYSFDNRNKKAGRTCYMCGSPDHLIRDCPIASTEHPMFLTGDHMFQGGAPGYTMPYWNAAAFPAVNPYMNMYGTPGMVPFSANMVPVTPYGVAPYVPPTYGSLPVPSGITRMGGPAPVRTQDEQSLRDSQNLELQSSDNRIKYCHEMRQRSFDYEDNDIQMRHELERLSEYKCHGVRGKALSNSEESHGWKLQKDHHRDKYPDQKTKSGHGRYEKRSHSTNDGRDRGSFHTDRLVSGVEDVHSRNYKYDEVRHKKQHHSSRKHHNSREQSDSDCSCSHHQKKKGRDVKRKDSYEQKHNGYIYESEPSYSGDQKKLHKDVTHGHGFREAQDRKKAIADELYRDRWKMVNDSNEDYHHNKRKRVH